jgi:hypothetical protein
MRKKWKNISYKRKGNSRKKGDVTKERREEITNERKKRVFVKKRNNGGKERTKNVTKVSERTEKEKE